MEINDNILIFGELLLRFSSSEEQFLSKDSNVRLFPGGSEANVVSSLAKWKVPCSYVTAIPDNALANNALKCLGDLGADVSKTLVCGDRLGLYFLLSANGLTSGQVVYDRKFSSFSSLKPGTINWDKLLAGHTWFHWTALTPALNENTALVCMEVLEAASRNGLKISVDLNYRSRLWDYGKKPLDVMPELVKYCDVIMGNIWAANVMLGCSIDENLGRDTSPETYKTYAEKSAKEIFNLYPRCKHVANTFRFMDNPRHNLFYGTYHTRGGNYISPILETDEVVDRIGSGDAFMAGLIYSLISKESSQDVIDKATSAGFKKLFVRGDFGDGSI